MGVVIILLGLLSGRPPSAVAQGYTFTSLSPAHQTTIPSINNLGIAAYAKGDFLGESIIFINDGIVETPLVNVYPLWGLASAVFHQPVINDNGDVAALVGPCVDGVGNSVVSCLIRVNAAGQVTILATAQHPSLGGADLSEIAPGYTMNNAGQVAALVTKNDGTQAIVRFDGPGVITDIAVQNESLGVFSRPSINDAGVVAFTAFEAAPPSAVLRVFSGSGGPLTREGDRPGHMSGGCNALINNNGSVLDCSSFPTLLYTAKGGVITTVVSGDEDALLSQLSPVAEISQNDAGIPAFVSYDVSGYPGGDFGLFTGNDPSQDTVVRKNDTLFGGSVIEVRMGRRPINNSGQVVFNVEVTDPVLIVVRHVVRADPLVDTTPPDTSITSAPPATTTSTSATFTFTSTEPGSFECALDGGPFTACTSPADYSGLAAGDHTFSVRAIDLAGSVDPTPASYSWTIQSSATAPAISGFSPMSGGVGTSVTITGGNFQGTTDVRFNGVSATFKVKGRAQITATAPAGVTTGPIAVTTPVGTAVSASSFTVLAAPTITNISPTSGPRGTAVTIAGTGFTGATAVKFNGTNAQFTVQSDTSIVAIVPNGAKTGPISVSTPGGTATSTSSFTVTK